MERAFRIFDCDGNGTVSMAEFIDTMHKFAGQSSDEKLVFLFRVYDLDGKYYLKFMSSKYLYSKQHLCPPLVRVVFLSWK